MELIKWNEKEDGQLSEQAMRSKLEAMGYHVTRYTYFPGTCFPEHLHDVDKIDGILSGRFSMSMDRQTAILEAGDMLVVPKGVMHSAEVVGDEPVVSLDAIRDITYRN